MRSSTTTAAQPYLSALVHPKALGPDAYPGLFPTRAPVLQPRDDPSAGGRVCFYITPLKALCLPQCGPHSKIIFRSWGTSLRVDKVPEEPEGTLWSAVTLNNATVPLITL